MCTLTPISATAHQLDTRIAELHHQNVDEFMETVENSHRAIMTLVCHLTGREDSKEVVRECLERLAIATRDVMHSLIENPRKLKAEFVVSPSRN